MGLLKILFIFFVLSFQAHAAYIDEVTIGGQPISVLGPLTDAQLRASAVPISVSLLPLPAGASTEATLSGLNSKIPTNLTVTAGRLLIDGSGVTQPISGSVTANQGGTWNVNNITGAISLPTGASTSALQTTGNTSLSNIDTDFDVALSTRATSENQTNGNQKTRVTSDGTNDALVTNAAPPSSAYAIAVRPISLELATHSIVTTATVVGNNKSMLAIQNTGTSVIRVREIWIINDQTTAVTGVAGLFEVRRITSFSGGTAISPVAFDSTDTVPAGISAATGATVAGETSLLRSGVWSTDEWGPGTSDTESFDHAIQQVTPFFSQTMNAKALTIRQNQGIHVKFATNSTAGAFNIRIVFTVE